MSKIITIGDLQFREKEPFYSSAKNFINWLVNQDFNNPDNIAIFLGDIVEVAKNTGIINYLLIDLCFNKLKFKKIYILQGNHDYSKRFGSALEPLKAFDNIKIIEKPEYINIEDIKCLFLPYYYPNTIDLPPMEEHYSTAIPTGIQYDYIFHHIEDESISFSENHKGIDISYIPGKRVGGHIHKKTKGYLGSALITRYDEREKDSYLLEIDTVNKSDKEILVPKFLDYKDITYPETIQEDDSGCIYIYNIYDCPSKEIAHEHYKNINIRKIIKEKIKEDIKKDKSESQNKSIKEYFEEFCKIKKVNKELTNKLKLMLN